MTTLQLIAEINKHIAILNDEMGGIQNSMGLMKIDIAVLKNQVGEIMWWFRAFAGAIIMMLVTQFWQLIRMRK